MECEEDDPCSVAPISETHASYIRFVPVKRIVLREDKVNKFLWKHIHAEFDRQNKLLQEDKYLVEDTEYYDKYCKHTPPADMEEKNRIINKYPLHGTQALTLWNRDYHNLKDFRKQYTVTRPVYLQKGKFDD